jgi:L-iditol 2-dehydrogenase
MRRLRTMSRAQVRARIRARINRTGWEGKLRRILKMTTYDNRSAYVKSPWQFQLRDNPVPPPGPGQLLVQIHVCGICGTDQHIADRTAADWQPFGHEVAGMVEAVGAGVTAFKPGDRVALDSSAPCGECSTCAPPPRGRARPDLCPNPVNYWLTATMGFGQRILAPHQLAVHVPEIVPLDIASLVEPLGVCIDLVQVAEVGPGDHVLVIGPGPLGLGAVFLAARVGAEKIMLAGRSSSKARLEAGLKLGADTLIETDKRAVTDTDFGSRKPDKILVTAPPDSLPAALAVAALGGIVSYIGVAWNEKTRVQIDADDLHFRKLSLRPSHAWPGTHAAESIRLLATCPELGHTLVSHRFSLDEIERAMTTVRDDRASVKKALVVT